MSLTYSPVQIANEFLINHAATGAIDPLKLQKLVYFANGWWLATKGQPLASEQPQVWRHGPVFKSLYATFARYRWNDIDSPAPGSPFGGPPKRIDGQHAGNVRGLLDWIWQEYGGKSGVELSELTHAKGTPWHSIAEESNYRVRENTPIPLAKDWDYFAGLARARGFDVKPLATA
jgi:uncharacterized phage-associated protein